MADQIAIALCGLITALLIWLGGQAVVEWIAAGAR